MCVQLNESNVAITPHFTPMLENLQANILKFHGRTFAYHLFFQIKKNSDIAALKKWISEFAGDGVSLTDHNGNPIVNPDGRAELFCITNAKRQLEDSALRKKDKKDGGTIFTFS